MDLSSGYFSPYRFSLSVSEMFSFSLDPEIVSFLWTTGPSSLPTDVDVALRYRIARPSHLFHIFLSSSAEEVTFLSTLKCSVVTTGVLVVVGISSLYTFKCLQWLRHNLDESTLLQNVKSLISTLSKPFQLYRRKSPGECGVTVGGGGAVSGNNNGTNSTGKQLCKRPSDLQILGNGSPRGGKLLRTSRDNSLERRLLTKAKTPLADCDIASGEEDINDIQGQYFGPMVQSATYCMELMGSSPEDSPIHASSPSKSLRTSPKSTTRQNNGPGESAC